MNKRIKEIADRCFSTLPNDDELEKFAELIVRECADWMETVRSEQGDRIGDNFYWASKMMEHFGVEE